ncbi:hypothetical protein [Burkholderia sp. F1]|uniref:hypothetical protein n=1 Tax=Burkholderia sp. F1 TaxID=3366817 RepID=UPI003D74E336
MVTMVMTGKVRRISGAAAKNWLYANSQGSIVAQANGSGATTGSQAYGPFEEPLANECGL